MAATRRSYSKASKLPCRPWLIVALGQLVLLLLLMILVAAFFLDTSYWFERVAITWGGRPIKGTKEQKVFRRPSLVESLCHFEPSDKNSASNLNNFGKWPWLSKNLSLPQNDFSIQLQRRNLQPPRNRDLFPELPPDHLIFVLYVHNRPQYLRLVVDGLSKVRGIEEVLLIVSYDGYFEDMISIVEAIRFCQVKQIFSPYSPHLFNGSFPGLSPGDCQNREDAVLKNCEGNADQYGNYRTPHIVSLKHHWWWMMNTVWDGLEETRNYYDHIVFIEEDHYLFPNAYRNIQILSALKACKCPDCYAANLAPADVKSQGEPGHYLVAEKIGNVGYAFNRTVWRKIHTHAREFCYFDDYNWDITMWSAVYPQWGNSIYTLRGPQASAIHFGKCGLHQGQRKGDPPCLDNGGNLPSVPGASQVPNIDIKWPVKRFSIKGYGAGFKGWGGWGDDRDRKLCLYFASMYHTDTIERVMI
eukprot:c26303_g1_i1 orf=893-2305(-)